jgi:hypothetical protein
VDLVDWRALERTPTARICGLSGLPREHVRIWKRTSNPIQDGARHLAQSTVIAEAIRLFKAGQAEESRRVLRDFLCAQPDNFEALLWFARVSPDPREAVIAAELALALQPGNEMAQRAIAAVYGLPDRARVPQPEVDVARLTGMTLAQARAVVWPFKGLRRPIGVLLDEGLIGLNDLGYAVEKAFDEPVRQAARSLLLAKLIGDRLHQPGAPLRLVEGPSYAEYQIRLMALKLGVVLGVVLALFAGMTVVAVVGTYFLLTGLSRPAAFALVSWLFIFLFAGIGLWLKWWFPRLEARVEGYRLGRDGEKKAADWLRSSLSAPWTLFHNLEWPHRRWGDVDLVLVGPAGVWAFEVKAYTTQTRNRGERWEYKGRSGWRKHSQDPSKQAKRNARNVKDFLTSKGASVTWVNAVVIWAGSDDALTLEDPAVPVWRLSEFDQHIEEFWRQQKLNSEQIEQCATALHGVIEAARAAA